MLIASCLEGAQAVAPLARQQKLPFFISGRSSHEYQNKNPNALSWLLLLDYEGQAIAKLITDQKWQRGAAMVRAGYFGVLFAEGIRNAIKEQNLDFNFEVTEIAQGSNPSGAEVQRLLRNKPEVVFLMMSEPAAAFIVKQLNALKFTGKIVLQSSMLQTYDKGARAAFKGALQQKFPANDLQFKELQEQIKTKLGDDVADDFVFSYDGFRSLLDEVFVCKAQQSSSLDDCLKEHMRNEKWREGASGSFRFMKDGSTQRPMVFKTITEDGFE